MNHEFADVASLVRAAWSEVAAPEPKELFDGKPVADQKNLHAVFAGKRFDQVDCHELLKIAFTTLSFMETAGRVYYTGTLILCQIECYLPDPENDPTGLLLLNLLTYLSQPWMLEGGYWTNYTEPQIAAIVAFLKLLRDRDEATDSERREADGLVKRWQVLVGGK